MYSLKKKLNKSLILNMLLVMLLMLIILNIFIQQLVTEQVLTRLQHDAESLISVIQLEQDKNWVVNPEHISTVYNRVRSGHYYVVKTPQKTIRSRSLFDFELSIPEIENGQSMVYQIKGAGEESWLVWQQIIHKKNQQIQVLVAEDIAPLQQQLIKFSIMTILFVVFITAVLIYMQQKILGRAFSVFDSLRKNLQSIRQGETEKSGTPVPLEISPLIAEIEILVEQLRQRIQRSRNAIGNLAHEIKRPLQVLSLQNESGKDRNIISQSVDDIRAIVERELRRAKISGSNIVGGDFRIKEDIPDMLNVIKKMYPAISVKLNLSDEIDVINIDRDDMLELIGNLLDNACKYAVSKIHLAIYKEAKSLIINIQDDGRGVESTQLEKITEKGFRLDETKAGHGLGLTICADIIESYQGQLHFSQSDMGGLKAEVQIPLVRL